VVAVKVCNHPQGLMYSGDLGHRQRLCDLGVSGAWHVLRCGFRPSGNYWRFHQLDLLWCQPFRVFAVERGIDDGLLRYQPFRHRGSNGALNHQMLTEHAVTLADAVATVLSLRHVAGHPIEFYKHDVPRCGEGNTDTGSHDVSNKNSAIWVCLESVYNRLTISDWSRSSYRDCNFRRFVAIMSSSSSVASCFITFALQLMIQTFPFT